VTAAPDAGVGAALRRLVTPFSVEITPREAKNLPPLQDVLAVGTAVYLTFLPRVPWPETVAVARRIAEAGMRPVPHLAARAVPDRAALRRMLTDLTAVGVDELLLVAGSLRTPVGEFHETAQILDSGCLEEAGIVRVGVAGHPEGSPDIGDDELAAALAAKNRIARERGLDVRIVTQFCFAAEPIVEWERRIRATGNLLPVHVGLPGLTSPARLLRFGLSCGVGPSLKVLRTQAGGVLKLASTSVYRPEETLLGLAAAVATDPRSLLRAVHFFPFGSLVPTAEWATGVRDGRITLHARPSVTA
jgi:methylenetetrahydrofolate reductase (NADPH)